MAKAIRMFTLAFLTAVGHCQITLYPNGTQSATAISSGCASAVGGSLNCNPYLQALAETNWYGSLNDTALQTSVCTSGCNTSLSTYHTTVSKACANDPQPWDGIPATWAGDILWATYNRTCLKDPTTGKYCTDFVSSIQSSLTLDSDITALPNAQLCSPCLLALFQTLQSTPYSNYGAGLVTPYQAVQSRCNVKYPTTVQPPPTNVTDIPGYASESANTTCLSGNYYTVLSGDNCQKIAAAKGVATGTLQIINHLLPDCSNLEGGSSICLPQACATYLVQSGDTCWAIASAHSISASKLISLNPTLNSDCTNLLSGTNICLSPAAGIFTPTTIAGATATQTGTYATSTVVAAGLTPHGTTANCGGYYKIKPGDNCQQISLIQQITVNLFEAINPSINSGCTNLVPDLYYCVFPTADWNATSSATSTSTASVYATAPAPTPTGTTPNCYQWHTVVSGDYCAVIQSTYGITFAQFQAWNPQINSSCGNLLLGDAYCVSGPSVPSPQARRKAREFVGVVS